MMGIASDVEIALPRLVERGLRAEFFVLAGLLGTPDRLDRDGVRELLTAGMSIGSSLAGCTAIGGESTTPRPTKS